MALIIVGLVGSAVWLRPATWDPAVEPYVAFVEESRGLEFDHPVNVRWLSVEEAVASGELSYDSDVSWAEPYQVLGLLPATLDVSKAQEETTASLAVAYYDPLSEEIVLPPGEMTVADQATVVHELTHALQHQHGLFGPERATANEYSAGAALTEGDAGRIEQAWLDARPEAELAEYEQMMMMAESESMLPLDDSYLESSFYEPYAFGDPAVELIVQRWGVEELDRRMRTGSVSTEFLIDPFARPDDEPYSGLIPFKTERDYHYSGSLGPIAWYQVLAPTVGPEVALQAVLGYGHDDFHRFEQDGAACLAIVYWSESVDDRAELVTALGVVSEAYQSLGPIEAPEGENWLRFDVCDPITSHRAQGVDVLTPLVVLAWVTVDGSAVGAPDHFVRCLAPRVAVAFDADETSSPDPWEQLDVLIDRFTPDCS